MTEAMHPVLPATDFGLRRIPPAPDEGIEDSLFARADDQSVSSSSSDSSECLTITSFPHQAPPAAETATGRSNRPPVDVAPSSFATNATTTAQIHKPPADVIPKRPIQNAHAGPVPPPEYSRSDIDRSTHCYPGAAPLQQPRLPLASSTLYPPHSEQFNGCVSPHGQYFDP